MKTLLERLGLLLLAVIAGLIFNSTSASAQDGESEPVVVYCSENGGPCMVMNAEDIAHLKDEAVDWGLYLQNGSGMYRAKFNFLRLPNPSGWGTWEHSEFAPSEVHIAKDTFTSLPEMGIYWWKGHLMAYKPGYLMYSEVPVALPSDLPQSGLAEISTFTEGTVDWNDVDYGEHVFTESYMYDGGKLITWMFVPVETENEIVLYVYDVSFTFFDAVPSLPQTVSYQYTDINATTWQTGEKLEILAANPNAARVPAKYMVDTSWAAIWEWNDNITFKRQDGTVYTVPDDRIMAEAPCTPDDGCYTKGVTPQPGEIFYVDGSTMWDMYDKSEYSNLWLANVDPAQSIRDEDSALLAQRWHAGELYKVEGTVAGVYVDDGSYQVLLSDGTHLELAISFAPPVGTHFTAYMYKNGDVAPYGDIAWPVMAVIDDSGNLWFFNTEAEYGTMYDHKVYQTYDYNR